MSGLFPAAWDWAAAGCSVLPVKADGSKAPAVPWKQYQSVPADERHLFAWFEGQDQLGVGVVTGKVSGNLEMLEFEGRAVTEGLAAQMAVAMDEQGAGQLWADLIPRGYAEQTPSGGIHLYYRVDGPARGNTKLARRPSTDAELAVNPLMKVQVLIETRGEGGYSVVAPTPGRFHPTGKPWRALIGSPATIPTITEEQRDLLYAVANMFDQMPAAALPEVKGAAKLPGNSDGLRPGDDFNNKADWADILQGWTRGRALGSGWSWARPGNTWGISATTGTAADGVDRLYVFSTSTEFDTEVPYSKFGAYTLLHHHGDFKAAAKALAAQGFGDRPKSNVTQLRPRNQGPPAPKSDGSLFDGTAAVDPVDPVDSAGEMPRYTDNGNAVALIDAHGDTIRFCADRGRWMHWNNHRWAWQPVGGGYVRELAKAVAMTLPDTAAGATWQTKSLSANGVTNTLVQAATHPRVTVNLVDLDAHPWELNTPGGIVDLRTGTLGPADPAQLHTRCTTVTPDPAADLEPWLQFLQTTFGGDAELVAYLQRLLGYSLTGYVGPHILPFAHGLGGNGKGVFLETIQKIAGDYATTAPNAFLMAQTYSQHETEIARLAGARMVLCSEVDEKDKFDEARIKQLTGGDTLTARFMRQDHFTFPPSHHLWLMGNYRPAVTSGGRSFWRRCRLIPFLHEVPDEKDIADLQGIFARLHGAAILAWVCQGAADFAAAGLREPASVTTATAEYANEQDTVGRFVEECCHRGPAAQVRVATRDLVGAYDRWCAEAGETPVTAKRLGMELRQRFRVAAERSNGKKFYAGICLLIEDKDDQESGTGSGTEPWWQR